MIGKGAPAAFEIGFEHSLCDAGMLVARCPRQVGVAEIDPGLVGLEISVIRQLWVSVLGTESTDLAVVAEEQVEDQSEIQTDVTGRGEAHDCADFDVFLFMEVRVTTMFTVVILRELEEGMDVLAFQFD